MSENLNSFNSLFKGRNIELMQGTDALKEKERNILLISGEAGVGKTRYLNELLKDINSDSEILLFSGKNNNESKSDDRTLINLLEQLILKSNKDQLNELPNDTKGILNLITDLLHSFLRNKNEIIIALEDIHWASGKQLDILFHLFTNIKLPGIKYCFTYRDEDDSSGEFYSFIKDTSALSYSHHIYLKPLAITVFEAIINNELNSKIDNENKFISLIHRYCQGNPLKLQLLLQHCLKTQIIGQKSDRILWNQETFELKISKLDIYYLIRNKIKNLDANLLQILRLYALIEEEISYDNTILLISTILGFDKNLIEQLLTYAIEEQLLYKLGEQLFFTHDRLKEALINHSGESHTVLHYRIAQFLIKNIPESVLLIAYHLAKGSSMIINNEERKNAVEIIDKAAELLLERNLPEQASWLCEVGISFCDSQNDECHIALMIKNIESQITAGDYEYAEQNLDKLWNNVTNFSEQARIVELYVKSYAKQKNHNEVIKWFSKGMDLCNKELKASNTSEYPDSSQSINALIQYVQGSGNDFSNGLDNELSEIDEHKANLLAIISEYFYNFKRENAKFLIASSIGLIQNKFNSESLSVLSALNKKLRLNINNNSFIKDNKRSEIYHKGEIENLKQELNKLNLKEAELSNLLIEREREIEYLQNRLAEKGDSSLNDNTLEEVNVPNLLDSKWNLSRREREICYMIRNGKTSKDIGIELNISYRTVDTYRNRIRKKFELNRSVSLEEFLNN